MDYQKYFIKFDNNIKLNGAIEKDILKKKINITDKLIKYLNDIKLQGFVFFDMGSFSMDTAVKSLNDEYDIDMGLCLDISLDEYKDPVKVKEIISSVFENDDEIEKVEMHRYYISIKFRERQDKININLYIYASNNEKDKLYIAKGKSYSSIYNKVWQEVNIEEIQNLINNAFSNEGDREQFKRIVRYLKKWNDLKIKNKYESSKLGFQITMLSLLNFYPVKIYCGEENEYNDLEALKNIVNRMIDKFETVYDEEENVERIILNLSVEPKNDIFNSISDFYMYELKKGLIKLSQLLNEVQQEDDIHKGCILLRSVFGQEFPSYNKCSINIFYENSITM